MNPKLNYRGPTSIDSTATSLDNQEILFSTNRNGSGTNKTGTSEPAVQRKLEEKDELLQKKEGNAAESSVSPSFEASIASTKGHGEKLGNKVHGFMSSKFGTDFGGVNVHNNSHSHKLAKQINAKAFTVGEDIYFNRGEYQPQTNKGKHLLAHELTHTIQQNNRVSPMGIQRMCNTKSANKFYTKSKIGKKIKWTKGLVEELFKVVGTANKVLYENALTSGALDVSFIALVCKAQQILGFTGDDVDGKIGPKTETVWEAWKTGGKHGINYGELFKDKKLEIGIAVGYDKGGMTKLSSALILAVLNDPKYGLKLASSSTTLDRYSGKRKYKVQGDNTAPKVEIELIIDLIDSTKTKPKSTFSDFVTQKEMTIYVGHARMGTGPDFDAKKSPAENFIIGVNSALHKTGKLKKGYSAEVNSYLKGKANDLERLSKAGKFDKNMYQVWFLNACSTIHYMDEIRGGLVTDTKGKKKSKDKLRIMGTNKPVGVGSAGVILKGILEMQTMEEIMQIANKKQGGGKQRYFAD